MPGFFVVWYLALSLADRFARLRRSHLNLQQLLVENLEHLGQFMPAFQDQASGGHHTVLALSGTELWPFLNSEQGHLAGMAENRENRRVIQEI